VNVITSDEQPFTARKMDSMTRVVKNCVVVHASIIFVWTKAC